jgi:hypothetical protein
VIAFVIAWAWLEEIPSASALLVECSRLAAWCSSTHSVETNDANRHAHLFEFFEPAECLGVGDAVNGEDGIELADFMLLDFGEIAVVAARTSCRSSARFCYRTVISWGCSICAKIARKLRRASQTTILSLLSKRRRNRWF